MSTYGKERALNVLAVINNLAYLWTLIPSVNFSELIKMVQRIATEEKLDFNALSDQHMCMLLQAIVVKEEANIRKDKSRQKESLELATSLRDLDAEIECMEDLEIELEDSEEDDGNDLEIDESDLDMDTVFQQYVLGHKPKLLN